MSASAAIRKTARLIAVMAIAQPVCAETILDQFLAKLGASPDLTSGAFFLNYAEAVARQGAQASTSEIDGSVYIATLGSSGTYLQVQAGAIELIETDPVQNTQTPLNVAASGVGTSNFGGIDVHRTNTSPSEGDENGAELQSYPTASISSLNGATTTVPVLGNVVVSAPRGSLPFETISASSIGASNTGTINISITTQADGVRNVDP